MVCRLARALSRMLLFQLVPWILFRVQSSRWAADSVRHLFLEKTRVPITAPPRTGNVEPELWNPRAFSQRSGATAL